MRVHRGFYRYILLSVRASGTSKQHELLVFDHRWIDRPRISQLGVQGEEGVQRTSGAEV